MSQAFAAVKAAEEQLLCRSYSRYPLAVVRGKGARLWDVDGKEYIDLLAGIAVTALGHCNDEICAALEQQARKLWHVSNLFYREEQLDLARRLLSTSHHGKAFFLVLFQGPRLTKPASSWPAATCRTGQKTERLHHYFTGWLFSRAHPGHPGGHGARESGEGLLPLCRGKALCRCPRAIWRLWRPPSPRPPQPCWWR